MIERLDQEPKDVKQHLLTLEKAGLLTLERSTKSSPPALHLSTHSQRLSFQIQATHLVTLTELLGKLPKTDLLVAIEVMEHLMADQVEEHA
ncbi:MAG: hypothetical protein JW910_15335 [Anaerolineae bacterium]|nr:hypothetical protein [Anaerolineae bacterium]